MKLPTALRITGSEGKGKNKDCIEERKNRVAEGEGSSEACLEPTRPDFHYYKGDHV